MKFNLNDKVIITVSSTPAVVIGRAEYIDHPSNYWLLFTDGNGNPREEWWNENRIAPAGVPIATVEAVAA